MSTEGGPPEGVNSAMLASMEQSNKGRHAGNLPANGVGTATSTGENTLDDFGKKSSISFGETSNFDLSGITGGGALEGNMLDAAEGNMALGGIGHNAWNAENMMFGDVDLAKAASPGKQTLGLPTSVSAHSALRSAGG